MPEYRQTQQLPLPNEPTAIMPYYPQTTVGSSTAWAQSVGTGGAREPLHERAESVRRTSLAPFDPPSMPPVSNQVNPYDGQYSAPTTCQPSFATSARTNIGNTRSSSINTVLNDSGPPFNATPPVAINRSNNTPRPQNTDSIHCPYCPLTFSRSHHLDRHLENIHGHDNKIFACSTCTYANKARPNNMLSHCRKENHSWYVEIEVRQQISHDDRGDITGVRTTVVGIRDVTASY
jgi:hypothetical protein